MNFLDGLSKREQTIATIKQAQQLAQKNNYGKLSYLHIILSITGLLNLGFGKD